MRFGSCLKVNFERLSRNFQKLKSLCPKNEILFMVKANAYGHGLIPISRFAVQENGIKELGVASLGEALALKENLPNENFEVYVFSDLNLSTQKELYLKHRITPVISNLFDLELFLKDPDFRNHPFGLKFNTGMNRLGIHHDEVKKVLDILKNHGRNSIDHLMTHFASASLSMTKNKKNKDQLALFEKIKNYFINSNIDIKKTSIANSGGIEQKSGLGETHIRPGLMLYGPSSLKPGCKKEGHWDGEIISDFKANIIDVIEVDQGTPVGYGATVISRSGIMAIIALGYGDGFSTFYRGATIYSKGVEGEVIGRINMDMAQVLFPIGTKLMKGEALNIWNADPHCLEQLTHQTGHIAYELFCQVSERVPRKYC